LRETNGSATVGLFSDWATGYYHSEYIALHLEALAPGQTIHLGDVYYTGSPKEVENHMEHPLQRQQLLAHRPVWLLNGNHEMMHHGIPFLDFIARKHATNPGQQPQESTYFCLYNDRYQNIGIDTDYTADGRFPADTQRSWLADRLHEGRANGKVNILLTQHEPYSNGPMQALLDADLRQLVLAEQLVDVWFWGDEHYAGLYAPSEETPFIGACIGHGGYPFPTRDRGSVTPDQKLARLVWWEAAARFPAHLGVRQDVGNNGLCHLELAPDALTLKFIDWRRQLRYHTRLAVTNGWVFLPDEPIYEGPPGGTCGNPA
jgi:hypothetical protein